MEHKKLYRSRSDRMIFGLCGGLGKYFNIDSTVVRIIFVLLTMPGGAGLFIYLVLSIITPLEVGAEMNPKEEMKEFAKKVKKETKEVAEEIKKDKKHGGFRVIIGAIIVAAGIFFMAQQFFPFFHMGMFFWPVLAIIFGIYLVTREK